MDRSVCPRRSSVRCFFDSVGDFVPECVELFSACVHDSPLLNLEFADVLRLVHFVLVSVAVLWFALPAVGCDLLPAVGCVLLFF